MYFVLLASIFSSQQIDHSNESLIKVKGEKLEEFIKKYGNDVWVKTSNSAEMRVNKTILKEINEREKDVEIEVIEENLQKLIDKENKIESRSSANWFDNYHDFDEIIDWYKNLANKYRSFVTFKQSIGKTYEQRDISAFHIKTSNNPKKVIWLQSLIHAREWISGPTLQYFVLNILKGLKTKHKGTMKLMRDVEIIVIPVVNPDGYNYSRKGDRMWRKNRNVVNGKKSGVDLNRNWPFHWGESGASSDPNAETYKGISAGSELETKAVMKYYKKYANKMAGSIDIHAYGEMILRPYGYTSNKPAPGDNKLKALANKMNKEISKRGGRLYRNIKASELYPASGGADDWFFNEGKNAYSYTLELSPGQGNSGSGFILDPKNIVPVGKQIYSALIVFIKNAVNEPLN